MAACVPLKNKWNEGKMPFKQDMSGVGAKLGPPSPPSPTMAYSRFVSDAPLKALAELVRDGSVPDKFVVTPRCRERKQVGGTNRWRLTDPLCSDLLGSYQAMRAVRLPSFDRVLKPLPKSKMEKAASGDNDADQSFVQIFEETSALTSPQHLKRREKRDPGFHSNRPISARPMSPIRTFLYHRKKANPTTPPDVLLQCLGTNWELHRKAAERSDLLRHFIKHAKKSEDRLVYSPSAKLNDLVEAESRDLDNTGGQVVTNTDFQATSAGIVIISVNITNPAVSMYDVAIALGNLYHDEIQVSDEDLLGVVITACVLRYKKLIKACASQIVRCIDEERVCSFYRVARKYGIDEMKAACVKWLELNLIPKLSHRIELRQISIALMHRLLKSNNLFVTSESRVIQTVCCWLYLRLNLGVQIMPVQCQIVAYFRSLPRSNSFLQREEGLIYLPLFKCLRLHGITDPSVLVDLREMNILPQAWILNLLSVQYKAIQTGGDMDQSLKFDEDALRYGFVLEKPPEYHSEKISLSGFHFELKAAKTGEVFGCQMRRLGQGDKLMSLLHCERQAYSMKDDRRVQYSVTVQTLSRSIYTRQTTGPVLQVMGVGNATSRSQTLKVASPTKPVYVMFNILFPPHEPIEVKAKTPRT